MAAPHNNEYGLLGDANVWLAASFLIFLFILWKMGKDKFTGMLDSKIAKIRSEIATAESLRIEAQELLAQYERKHRDAVNDAEMIIKNAQKSAQQIKIQAEKDLEETMARREKQLAERLERMQQNAIAEIQQHAANLAIQATKEIIIDNMDKKISEKLIDQSIKDVSGQIN